MAISRWCYPPEIHALNISHVTVIREELQGSAEARGLPLIWREGAPSSPAAREKM